MWSSPIFDQPDDDAPRLALAAERDARRDPRDADGAVWRAPLEAAVRPCPMSPGEARDFVHRPRIIDEPIYAARFRRGFIDAVHMEASAFAADGAAALAIEPVRAVRLYRPARLLASICASPVLAQIEALE